MRTKTCPNTGRDGLTLLHCDRPLNHDGPCQCDADVDPDYGRVVSRVSWPNPAQVDADIAAIRARLGKLGL